MNNTALHAVNLHEKLASLPPQWPVELLPDIRRSRSGDRKLIVLDDDPTGTQTVHDIPVLTTWTADALQAELESDCPAIYLLTNSRSLGEADAVALAREIGTAINEAAGRAGVSVEVISRSDSTLRGHFPAEVDALAVELGLEDAPYLIIPFFLEGGRYTLDDVHYVAEGDTMMPAAETSYARDAVFGYSQSNLRQWVAEKTADRLPASVVLPITLDDLRLGGPNRVAEKLGSLGPGTAAVVNAASYRDLEVFVMGLLMAEAEGHEFLARSAASYVRVRAGIPPRPLLDPVEMTADNGHGGLFVVGSYVPKTTGQLHALIERGTAQGVEVHVEELLDDVRQAAEIQRVTERLNKFLLDGTDVVVYTSRDLTTGLSDEDNLAIGRQVSDSLIAIVRALAVQPRYLVAKGGITSSDVATKGLDVRRAIVLGQILPGVPVWQLGDESRYPGMAYTVFPGNVGDDDALLTIQQQLAGGG